MNPGFTTSRRGILKAAVLPVAAPYVSRLSWVQGSPMQRLQYAAIGADGRGGADIGSMISHAQIHIVAAADVDAAAQAKVKNRFSELETFFDWREMLRSRNDEIDIVSVSTPDHMHGIQAMSAMNLGKHVYVQKPLAQSIGECRAMQETAKRNDVLVQMGTQGASSLYDRMATALIQQEPVGKISEVWTVSGKSWGDTKPFSDAVDPVPEGLDWNGWLGVGEERPYVDNYYHPKNWRRRQEYGCGTLGDMGCHIFNAMYRGLELTAPTAVRSATAVPNRYNWTSNERVEYRFPGTRYTESELRMTWVSGRESPPAELMSMIPEGTNFRFGCLLVGSEGVLMTRHGSSPMVLPREKFAGVRSEKLESMGGHHHSFIDAVIAGRGDGELLSPIDFAAPLTEFILLGNIAMQHSPDWLEWDSKKAKIINNKEASERVHRSYREGWAVMGAGGHEG